MEDNNNYQILDRDVALQQLSVNEEEEGIHSENENDSEDQSIHDKSEHPICSVLNTVIDYAMVPPTLYEQEEFFQSNTEKASKPSPSPPVLVPVIRVFGPLLRRDTTMHESILPDPVQSACLYIHNAFPYMLARPKAAGPDGSSVNHHYNSGSIDDEDMLPGQVDWDDVLSVERILPVLQETLEASIQSSFQDFAPKDNAAAGQTTAPTSLTCRVIRKITVVCGRGFYTYCPGPPAPFLRIEYYDPSQRWKVKRILERGLADLPDTYHPYPPQYNEDPSQNEPLPEVLQFSCYEAHIPYSMQFFKDYNLAGMSYIHLSLRGIDETTDCQERNHTVLRFRKPLPPKLRTKTLQRRNVTVQVDECQPSTATRHLFLESNTPNAYRWDPEDIVEETSYSRRREEPHSSSFSVDNRPSLQQPSLSSSAPPFSSSDQQAAQNPDYPSPRKETSCDIELDVSVENILNVLQVIREMPKDEVTRESTHWRAVPSLYEIWQEERRRMAKLIPEKDNFLSQNNTPSHLPPSLTLNVKKGAPQPGTRLAVQGMKELLGVSPGLEESFRRSIKQIVARHENAVRKADDVLRRKLNKEKPVQSTPSFGETEEALEALGDLFERDNDHSPIVTSPTSQHTERVDLLSSSHFSSQSSSQPSRFQAASQSYYDRGKNTVDDEQEEFALSQRIDRGDGIVSKGAFESLEDFINPQTLTPYEEFDDEEDEEEGSPSDERGMEQMLNRLATQNDSALTQANEIGDVDTNDDEVSSVESIDLLAGRTMSERRRAVASQGGGSSFLPTIGGDEDTEAKVSVSPSLNGGFGLSRKPPSRTNVPKVGRLNGLLPIPSTTDVPPFLVHMSAWAPSSEATSEEFLFQTRKSEVIRLCPTKSPPTRGQIVPWRAKRIDKKRRRPSEMQRSELLPKRPNHVLQIDGNSRQLIAMGREVEEIEWKPSQQLLASQADETKDTPAKKDSSIIFDISEAEDPNECPATALGGMENQGGRLRMAGGGDLKAKTRPSQVPTAPADSHANRQFMPTPLSLMVLEIHVQCRSGRAGVNDSKTISMTPDPNRDKVSAVVYVYGRDPGGGQKLETIERGCVFLPVSRELENADDKAMIEVAGSTRRKMPEKVLGISSPLTVECVRNEKDLLLRIASIVRVKDPDMLLSWDTQGAGLGYLIERGVVLGKDTPPHTIDLSRLFSRTPERTEMKSAQSKTTLQSAFEANDANHTRQDSSLNFEGSGLGRDWDERVGAGAAAASISGRVVLAGWKIVAEEVKHPNASYLPAVTASVLNQRIPYHDNLVLTNWYGHQCGRQRWRVLHYRLVQATSSLMLFDALDIVGRSGEAARLSGVEFSQSFPGIRGSQYKVEGVLLRALQSLNSNERGLKKGTMSKLLSHDKSTSLSEESTSQSPWKARRRGHVLKETPHQDLSSRSYFFYSPSLQDADRQEALEVQALTLEPESGCYFDPVVVCDFTALYPSLVIAYNLCYSTIAGRLDYHSTRAEMMMEGRTTEKLGPFHYGEGRSATVLKHHFRSLNRDGEDRAYVSPTGSCYVSESVLKGVLPQVLDEILSTRAMLKKASKLYKKMVPNLSPSILRQLEARQLALKYVANVTYGYTSATFSGRCAMPLLADTIVECGRRTLTRAINLANSWGEDGQHKWYGCKVIYGDTDSVFVKLPGRSVQEAFAFGDEFCKSVTASNPPPVQLKLEKVYRGSLMQTKKKYCGMKYDSVDQQKPQFEAKGLETIRRDQCVLTQKILRNCLVTLFRSGLHAVKAYLFRQYNLILSGELPVSDFILTGRVRSRYRGGKIGPVQAVLARRLAEADPGRVVRHKERLSYVIVATPGVSFRLRDCVLTPMELLEQWDAYTIHTGYYITKHVNAALQRCLGLPPYNVDINAWYESCPKPSRRLHFWPVTRSGNSVMISSFFGSDICSLCSNKCESPGLSRAAVCRSCRMNSIETTQQALQKLNSVQHESARVAERCRQCNLCFEDSSTFACPRLVQKPKKTEILPKRDGDKVHAVGLITPLAHCTCIDCPVTYKRHRLRELELEALAVCEAIHLF